MEVTLIDKDNLQYFETLLYPQTVAGLRAEQPVIALGAVDGGMACGALAGGPEGDFFRIESIFVSPSCRGRGAGTALLDELVRLCALQPEIEELRCSFTVQCEEHEKMHGFLEKHDFRCEELSDGVVSVSLSALEQIPFYRQTKPAFPVYSFSELSESQIRSLEKRLTIDAGPLFRRSDGWSAIERDLSTATLAGVTIDGCLLFEVLSDGRFSLCYADAGGNQSGGSFASMLIKSYQTAVKKYPAETQIQIQPVSEPSQVLVNRLAPGAKNLSYSAVRLL